MSCRTARQLLTLLKDFHHQLGDFYADMETKADRERVKALLGYMRRREESLQQNLERYDKAEAGLLLDTWFARMPEIARCECFEGPQLSQDMSIEDVVSTAMWFDDCLIEFVREMAELAPSDNLKEVFSSLANMEEQEERKVSRAAFEITHGM